MTCPSWSRTAVLGPGTGAGQEPAGVDAEHLDDLARHVPGQLLRRGLLAGDQLRRADDAVQVSRRATGVGLLPAPPQRQLGDPETDHHQEHGGLEVGALLDGELAVGLGQEEVEPRAAGDGCDDTGGPVTRRGGGDDDQHEDQHRRRGGDAVPEQRQERRHEERYDRRGGDQRRSVPAQPPGVRPTIQTRAGATANGLDASLTTRPQTCRRRCHRSRTTSSLGTAQQTRTLPSAGGSTGCGS